MDRNIGSGPQGRVRFGSLSARRAWIEMQTANHINRSSFVALRKESVDRNLFCVPLFMPCTTVALRKESVDRNLLSLSLRPKSSVALRKESVDRNIFPLRYIRRCLPSLSARRAWIEICSYPGLQSAQLSLSARRAWIEIMYIPYRHMYNQVALRKESVDRNSAGRESDTEG